MSQFHGIWVPLVTPFHQQHIDIPALQNLARRMVDAEVAGLVVCGSTGEAAALNAEEQLAVLDAVIEAVPDCPIIMGAGDNNLDVALAHLKEIQRRPVAGLLISPPGYIRPSQAGIIDYFQRLADAATVPIILYNIPYRTGVHMSLNTIRTLAQHPRIAAIKDCGGDAMMTMQLIADGKLQVLSGEDHQLFSTLCLGGHGAIAASSHFRPDWFVKIYRLIQAGELAQARQLFHRLLPMIGQLFEEPNPAPIKALLAQQGIMRADLRAPMQAASDALAARLQSTAVRLRETET